jgi:formylglycine-generating enzyme required for sulfatase activity
MKQNYKIYLCALLLISAASMMTAGAQTKPKLAVLVVGMSSVAKGDEFAARLGSDLNREGEYTLVTKDDDAVASKLAALRAAHTPSTPVDTTGLAAWGRQNGIDMVQLVAETIGTQISVLTAQLLDCHTGQLVGRGTYRRIALPKEMANPLPEMVRVNGGVFEMGCKEGRDDRTVPCNSNELPLHTVRVSSFSIGKYEITQAQWKAVMGSLPSDITSNFLDDSKPMIYVNWTDIAGANGYLVKLNELTGWGYRLPTEAEWEYAARGCNGGKCENYEYSGSNTSEDVARYYANIKGSGPQPVGTKAPNALGIYDMSGNGFEWCHDYYSATFYTTASNPLDNPENTKSSSYRVARGGGWFYDAEDCRIASRAYPKPSASSTNYVFRVVLP